MATLSLPEALKVHELEGLVLRVAADVAVAAAVQRAEIRLQKERRDHAVRGRRVAVFQENGVTRRRGVAVAEELVKAEKWAATASYDVHFDAVGAHRLDRKIPDHGLAGGRAVQLDFAGGGESKWVGDG